MRLIILTTFLVVALLTIIPFGLTLAIKYLPGGIQPSLESTERVWGDYILSQSFISPKNHLAGIGISIKNPFLKNKEDVFINVFDEQGILIRSSKINGQNIEDGKFVKIIFPPIPNSEGKKFSFSFSSPASTYNDALQIFLTGQQTPWSLELQIKGEKSDQNLSYVTLHAVSSPIEILSIVYTNWLGKFISDTHFLISYTALLFFTFLLMFSPIARKRP